MKSIPSLLFPAIAALALAIAPGVSAQTSTTTTTVVPNPDDPTTVIKQTTVTTTQPTPLPGQHLAEIEIVVAKGSVQAYFGNAARGEKLEIGTAEINVKLPSRATVTKLASRDGDSEGSKKITPDNPWRVSVPFDGPGRYVFNISDWDDAVVASCTVRVDGQVLFSGHGSEDEFKGWAQTFYGEGVRRTGDREIAFIVAGPRS